MDFGRAFTYAFEDPDWMKKVGIAALVLLIPLVGGIIVLGWSLEITRRVINNDPQPLPDWSDFGGFLSKGFQAFVVSLAYALPVILVVICGQVVNVGLAAALSNSSSSSSNSNALGGVVMVVGLCMACFSLIFGIAAGLLIPPAIGSLADSGQLGAAFRFNEVFGLLRAAPGPYIMSILGVFLAALVLSPLGSLICGIGVLITSAYLSLLSGHLYGQAYKAARAALGTAPAL